MISAVVTAFVSFASTNIDDIFVLMLFFSQAGDQLQKRHIIIGQYLGIMLLLFISILGSIGLNLIPQQYTGLLGIVPVLLGIKEWLKYRKDKKAAADPTNEIMQEVQREPAPAEVADNSIIENSYIDTSKAGVKQAQATKKEKAGVIFRKLINPVALNVFLVTIANGADNIGVYIPLFTRLNILELITTIIIFLLLIAVWCFIGERLTNFPYMKHTIQKYKNVVVPLVFIVIGLFILIESDLFILLLEKLLKSLKCA